MYFNIVVGVVSYAVRVEIFGLLFFLSKYVMWGRVNIVGHDEAEIGQSNLSKDMVEFNNKSRTKIKEDKKNKKK